MRVWILASILVGCTGSDCPEPFIQVGKVCKCPEGTKLMRGACIGPDAGEDALPEDDETAEGGAEGGPDGSPITDAGAGAMSYADSTLQDAPVQGAWSQQADGGAKEQQDAASAVQCYVDRDKDGVGTGAAVDCANTALVEGLGHKLANLGGDCDDNDAQRSPSLSDVCGDKIDNDCDGKVDDESNNACGGPCAAPLAHQPGEACSNDALGACLRSGTYECRGANIVCSAVSVTAGAETCGDQIDNAAMG